MMAGGVSAVFPLIRPHRDDITDRSINGYHGLLLTFGRDLCRCLRVRSSSPRTRPRCAVLGARGRRRLWPTEVAKITMSNGTVSNLPDRRRRDRGSTINRSISGVFPGVRARPVSPGSNPRVRLSSHYTRTGP